MLFSCSKSVYLLYVDYSKIWKHSMFGSSATLCVVVYSTDYEYQIEHGQEQIN